MLKRNIIITFSLFLSVVAGAQDKASQRNVSKLENEAMQLYREGKYAKALPLFSQLLSLEPKNPRRSLRFGVCLLYGDRRDTEKPLRYLDMAAKSPEPEPEVFYYLGLANHFNYRFTEAIKYYERFQSLTDEKTRQHYNVSHAIGMCKNGFMLLSQVSDLYVLDRQVVDLEGFHRSYKLRSFGGEFLLKPEIFMTKLDKKRSRGSIVFFPGNSDRVYFSSYGTDGKNGKDLYFAERGPDGRWEKPGPLPGAVNTPFDEDYPFILPGERVLYFCSQGHNSMGGYDIFRSVLDTVSGQWGAPENLDFAVNTPFDDLLFVTDPDQREAYFASNRSTSGDQVCVYSVRIDRRPEELKHIDLNPPLAGDTAGKAHFERSLSVIKDMSMLEVNANPAMFGDTVPAAKPVVIAGRHESPVEQKTGVDYNERLQTRIKQQERSDKAVDSAFRLVKKMELSLSELVALRDEVKYRAGRNIGRTAAETGQKIVDDMNRKVAQKRARLENARYRTGNIQQLASMHQHDSALQVFEALQSSIEATDTGKAFREILITDIRAGRAGIKKSSPLATVILSGPTLRLISRDTAGALALLEPEMMPGAWEEQDSLKKIPVQIAVEEKKFEKPGIPEADTLIPPTDSITTGVLQAMNYVSVQQDSIREYIRKLKIIKTASLAFAEDALSEADGLAAILDSLDRVYSGRRLSGTAMRRLSSHRESLLRLHEHAVLARNLASVIDEETRIAGLQLLSADSLSAVLGRSTKTAELAQIKEMLQMMQAIRTSLGTDSSRAERLKLRIAGLSGKAGSESESLSMMASLKAGSALIRDSLAGVFSSAAAGSSLKEDERELLNRQTAQLIRQSEELKEETFRIYNESVEAGNMSLLLSRGAGAIPTVLGQIGQKLPAFAQPQMPDEERIEALDDRLADALMNVLPAADSNFTRPAGQGFEEGQAEEKPEMQIAKVFQTPSIREHIKKVEKDSILGLYSPELRMIEERMAVVSDDKKQEEEDLRLDRNEVNLPDTVIKKGDQAVEPSIDKGSRHVTAEEINRLQGEREIVLTSLKVSLLDLDARIEGDTSVAMLPEHRQALLGIISRADSAVTGYGEEKETLQPSPAADESFVKHSEQQKLKLQSTAKRARYMLNRLDAREQKPLKPDELMLSNARLHEIEADILFVRSSLIEDSLPEIQSLNELRDLGRRLLALQDSALEKQSVALRIREELTAMGGQAGLEQKPMQLEVVKAETTSPDIRQKPTKSGIDTLLQAVEQKKAVIPEETKPGSGKILADEVVREHDASVARLRSSLTKIENNLQSDTSVSSAESQLTALDDVIRESESAFRRIEASGREAKGPSDADEQIAMYFEIKGFEVRAAANRARYLSNRLRSRQLITAGGDEYLATRARLLETEADILFLKSSFLADSLSSVNTLTWERSMISRMLSMQDSALLKQEEALVIRKQRQLLATTPVPSSTTSPADRPLTSPVTQSPAAPLTLSPASILADIPAELRKSLSPRGIELAGTISIALRSLEPPVMDELYYSVQVGVFATPRVSAQLFNVPAMFGDRLANGYYRYFSGIYGSRASASAARNEIARRGIPDAFVVAFKGGRKISMAEAAKAEEGSISKQISETGLSSIMSHAVASSGPAVVFRVQLGAYRRELSESDIAYYSARCVCKIELFRSESGLWLAMTPSYTSYEEANKTRAEIIRAGIGDAFIVGFIGGVRTKASTAREALKK